MKRIFDLLLGVAILVLLVAPMLLISIAVRLSSKGPALYWSDRVGKNNKIFRMPKFRSMLTDTPAVATHLLDNPGAYLSPIGGFLRRSSLDELPQLLSVLKGDMSFVGPRPDVPGYADKLEGKDRIILSVKPGITGPATLKYKNEEEILANVNDPVKYNNEVIWPGKVKINKEYIKNWSLKKDIEYILKTIKG